MKVRLQIFIDKKVNLRFRKKFVRKKGDLSKFIEELMVKKLKSK
ncbi:hypothetical protein LCGC14_0737610 [marine sediment metagenome]|uniref:Uncharacterized protein n=1 Tax=marine sediment metagenome TaxID=412755 RepID=A0A0F9Q7L1_9ZZZZ